MAVRPVRISASAIADNVPYANLYLSKYHALYIDGVLVPVADLINGCSIVMDDAEHLAVIEYFHILFEGHDVIDAQGAPCESLLPDPARLPAGTVRADRLAPCAPRVGFDGGRSQLKSRLRSALSPVIDCRQPLDRIRDRLEERGLRPT